jgi:acyl-CoA synthetase (AMP-forming)/AMP-acid ligase II
VLLRALTEPSPTTWVRVGEDAVTQPQLATAVATVSHAELAGLRGQVVALVAQRHLDTVVALAAALTAGATVVPLDPGATAPELGHVLADSRPAAVLHAASIPLPPAVAQAAGEGPALPLVPVDGARAVSEQTPVEGAQVAAAAPPSGSPAAPVLIMYTSGTTGRPKGVVLSGAAVEANLDALAAAWAWTAEDVLTHALPLHHVHGLVLGVLGPLRVGGGLHHTGAFDVDRTADALLAGATVHFGVPTMYQRLADAAEADRRVADALAGARLLVSGSAGLPRSVHERLRARTGQVIVERYGMTETLITTAVPAGCRDRAGTVGRALPGVTLEVVDDEGGGLPADGETLGELRVRTPSMFDGYLGDPGATGAAWRDGWFLTGDMGTIDADGFVRIAGRRSSDLIKSGGYRIGAGEIEDVLLEHPAVAEAAVRGLPDDDLGERIVAWVVPAGGDADALDPDEVRTWVGTRLARHKCPRVVVALPELPRNGMGKVRKDLLDLPLP